MTNEQWVDLFADAVANQPPNEPPSTAIVEMLRATALTRGEQERHELARQALARTSAWAGVALELLRLTIFALA